jgi:hypothetical protein
VKLWRRKRPEILPNDWILHHDNAPAHKVFSINKSITETEYPTFSLDVVLNAFRLFPKIQYTLKRGR